MIGKLLTVNKIQPWSPDNLRFHLLVFQPFSKEKNLLNQEQGTGRKHPGVVNVFCFVLFVFCSLSFGFSFVCLLWF